MSTLVGIHKLSKSHGSQELFEGLDFSLSEGEKVGLLGPNGAGKSTLLKILIGQEVPDSGHLTFRQGLRMGYAAQDPEFQPLSLIETLLQGTKGDDPVSLQTEAQILLSKAGFSDFTQDASILSGGWKKRLDIVRALMQKPHLLLMDEPTNHLDLEGILWLEKFLVRQPTGYLVVSHDRYFLENVCNKIIELNRCYPDGVFICDGSFSYYLERKEAFLAGQQKRERSLSNSARDEVDWLRRSPKARTTKSVSRIQRAYELLDDLSGVQKRNKTVTVSIDFSSSERETQKLLVGKNLTKSYGDKTLFKGVDIVLSPGMRLGIMGKNGTGKSTLLKILAGQIAPDMGTRKVAQDIKIVYFDQHRERLSSNLTLKEALCPNGEMVNVRGQMVHVNGWAKRFLFSPERLSLPIRCLSGGERARILIAKLMLEPADILFLDEPTNDLDIATLEVLEESLKEFPGALVLISHDRCLVDRLCTQILGLGTDNDTAFFADYAQWEKASFQPESDSKKEAAAPVRQQAAPAKKKLTYHEQKELDTIQSRIEQAEKDVELYEKRVVDPAIQSDAQKTLEAYQLLAASQATLEQLYNRWQELLDKTNASGA